MQPPPSQPPGPSGRGQPLFPPTQGPPGFGQPLAAQPASRGGPPPQSSGLPGPPGPPPSSAPDPSRQNSGGPPPGLRAGMARGGPLAGPQASLGGPPGPPPGLAASSFRGLAGGSPPGMRPSGPPPGSTAAPSPVPAPGSANGFAPPVPSGAPGPPQQPGYPQTAGPPPGWGPPGMPGGGFAGQPAAAPPPTAAPPLGSWPPQQSSPPTFSAAGPPSFGSGQAIRPPNGAPIANQQLSQPPVSPAPPFGAPPTFQPTSGPPPLGAAAPNFRPPPMGTPPPPGGASPISRLNPPPTFGNPQQPQSPYPQQQFPSPIQQPLLHKQQPGLGLPPPPIGAPPPTDGYSTPGYGYAGAQSIAEEFQSLTIQQKPGSLDAGLDPASLPRPMAFPDMPQTIGPTNARPLYVRLTTNCMPNSQSLRARWHLPLGAVVHPLAEAAPGEEVPIINCGPSGIVRCRRCRTYVNPYVTFVDGGRRWRCNVCNLLNEVPVDYFCLLDSNGRRTDVDQRPELSQGSVEYEAPAEYMVRPPMPPVYFFLIDVSAGAASSGMLQVMAETVKSCLDRLPGTSRTQVGFLTFDSTLHFYNLKSSLTQPQMLVVPELEETFLPLPDDLLVNLSESRCVVDALLDGLPAMFQNNQCIESALGPALKATYMIMSQLGGKLLVFQSTLPSLGPGRLRLRGEDPRMYGTDREHSLRTTDDAFYKSMAADCSRVQISINVYAFSPKYSDLASLGTLSRYTSGQVYFYPGFQAARDGEKFSKELARDLTRETGWEAVIRIRCGKGLKITTFHGHFFVRSIDLLALPAVDCDKGIAVQISHEETLLTTPTVYFQCAVLYTSSSGERRIRVHTVATPVVSDLGEMYRNADAAAITTLLGKIAIDKAMTARLDDARQLIQSKVIQALKEYKQLYTAHRLSGRLIYPESLTLLPVLTLGLCKSPALRGGFQEMSADQRSWAMFEMMSMPVTRMLRLLYPLLMRLDTMPPEAGKPGPDGEQVVLPPALPLSHSVLDVRGAFLLDDGLRILLWLGKELPAEWEMQLVGKAEGGMPAVASIAPTGSEVSKRVMAIVEELRRGNSLHQQVIVTRPGDPSEHMFFQGLLEDRGAGGTSGMSYADYIVHLYRQVYQK
eukprot:TRINITY_DN8176_c0_g1_i1.p1 TRINITY_DN8176_c0_g1~~TRINITY_DN8176_c0_g1_i1.p1  ORF type:complete len:1122 (-),score=208.46 TRINITY_DN8176_c0_g1_i1:465-3830(-)